MVERRKGGRDRGREEERKDGQKEEKKEGPYSTFFFFEKLYVKVLSKF